MKKGVLVISLLSLLAIVSCTKNYVCSCHSTTTIAGNSVENPKQDHILTNFKKQAAIDSCNAGDIVLVEGNTTLITNCDIK